ncbi:NERD domain-containing protein, partial [Chloroflexota bacterium]
MKIITNQKIINRRSNVGFWSSMISPVVMVFGASLLFSNPEQVWQSLLILSVGYILYQIGLSFRRYGRGTNQELNKTLKKLGKDYSLYHFSTPVSHLLIGPAGVWLILPKYCKGTVTYNERRRRWRLTRPSLLTRIFFFLTEGIGNPARELLGEADALDRFLIKNWERKEKIHVQAVVVCMLQACTVDAENTPVPTLHLSKLRGFIRHQEQASNI